MVATRHAHGAGRKVLRNPLVFMFVWLNCQLASGQPAQQSAQQPVFKSSVELILVDVTVLDGAGRQIPDLSVDDFAVVVAGKKRRVVEAQYSASLPTDDGSPSSVGGATPETTAGRASLVQSRVIFIVVDIEGIRAGEGRGAMQDLMEYVDRLPADDKVGLLVWPTGDPVIEPTTDRTRLRSSLPRIFGMSNQTRSCGPTFGEAAAASARDPKGRAAWTGRVASLACPIGSVVMEQAITEYREHAFRLIETLKKIATALTVHPGRRAIVLASEGIFGDDDTRRELDRFGAILETSRVQLYGLHLDFPLMEAATRGNITLSRTVDDRYGLDAMAELAVAAGGEAIRAISGAQVAIKRLDAATSGGYLIAFERDPSYRFGRRLPLRVIVNRKDADVRARTHVILQPVK